jgi:AcrR family transcriptional regulator
MTVSTAAERPLRRDAERNRGLLLAAARELFAERGLSVTLDDIAARAGLGVGTAYRRFGSRDELVEALFEERVEEIVALADAALEADDPWQGFVGLLERLVELQAGDRGLKEILLGSPAGRERVCAVRDRMRPRVVELIRRCQEAGELRADFCPSDTPLLQMMVGAIADVAPEDRPDLWRRFLGFLLDGLRAPGREGTALAAPPLGFERIGDAMCRWRPPRARP